MIPDLAEIYQTLLIFSSCAMINLFANKLNRLCDYQKDKENYVKVRTKKIMRVSFISGK